MSRSLLILGGTAWLGAEIARQAVARGWDVTCLARGTSGVAPAGATLVPVDRSSPGAYDAVAGRRFDAVVEVSWQPRFVQEALVALAGATDHWTYVSSVSVYAAVRAENTEDSPRQPALDPRADATGADYAQAKVACEDLTLALRPQALIARPGLIVGPGDPSDRFGYWPARAALAGEGPLLVPKDAAPTQSLDVRDLAAWILDAGAAGVVGPVNAVGEQIPLADVVALAREVAGHTGEVREATTPWLAIHRVVGWSGPRALPLWVAAGPFPPMGTHASARYRDSGGAWRPQAETMRDVLAWERGLGVDRERATGLSRDAELELIGQLP
ncbi:reductase [Demequina capsici]|uniref:Reductase n=1 Tax=Demequina capsici TaxID=3075620 RepID=A0AA96JA78_9MICO|nr:MULTISPECIES: NAD-dependent epimerase/dehydratase family protein [unclassified Demequina]WNM24328.1 reductase [Demequina sp. OYTSA14]WNM27150.1 reductase [Demequina sp. PMTSA13]